MRIDNGMPKMPVLPGDEPKGPRNDEGRGFVSREALSVTTFQAGNVKDGFVGAAVERDMVRNDAIGRLFDRYQYPPPPMREPWA